MRVYGRTDFNFTVGETRESYVDAEGNTRETTSRYHGQSKSVADVLEVIKEDGYNVIIIDNLDAGRNFSSNMSDNDVGSVIAALRAMVRAGEGGNTVVMVSHTNAKDEPVSAGLVRTPTN